MAEQRREELDAALTYGSTQHKPDASDPYTLSQIEDAFMAGVQWQRAMGIRAPVGEDLASMLRPQTAAADFARPGDGARTGDTDAADRDRSQADHDQVSDSQRAGSTRPWVGVQDAGGDSCSARSADERLLHSTSNPDAPESFQAGHSVSRASQQTVRRSAQSGSSSSSLIDRRVTSDEPVSTALTSSPFGAADRRRVNEEKTENARLRDILETYGAHKPSCAAVPHRNHALRPCDCGWDAIAFESPSGARSSEPEATTTKTVTESKCLGCGRTWIGDGGCPRDCPAGTGTREVRTTEPPLRHRTRAPGISWCGSYGPNEGLTETATEVTCPRCFEAPAELVMWNGTPMRVGRCPFDGRRLCLACERLGHHLEPA